MIDFSSGLNAIMLAVFVAVVGMPHGGLDYYSGRGLLQRYSQSLWWAIFLVTYLGVAGLVVTGWFIWPFGTVVCFFLISAWHFGDELNIPQPASIVDGGMVIWVPLLARPAEVANLLVWVIPDGDTTAVTYWIGQVQPLLWAIAVFFVFQLPQELSLGTCIRKVIFATIFALLPTLVSFGLYFCGWHSTRELYRLALNMNPIHPLRGLGRVLYLAGPFAMLAVLITSATAWRFAEGRIMEPVLVQAVFLGLSAVAIPHILLQEVARRYGASPFAKEPLT
jgi:beta-carotene 15,15'-dioxygenase